jgi:hypothetical protein
MVWDLMCALSFIETAGKGVHVHSLIVATERERFVNYKPMLCGAV